MKKSYWFKTLYDCLYKGHGTSFSLLGYIDPIYSDKISKFSVVLKVKKNFDEQILNIHFANGVECVFFR